MDGPQNWFEPSPRKTIRIGLPKAFQYSLIWTLFFSIIGIFIQFIETKVFSFPQTITDFYVTNYSNWFASFGNFTAQNFYYSKQELINSLLSHWYYFFLTAGLISLIWGILSWIIHLEANFRLPEKEQPSTVEVKTLIVPQKVESEKIKPNLEKEQNDLIAGLLGEGAKALASKNIKSAEEIYGKIKKEYSSEKDPSKNLYGKILDFYNQLANSR